jgi:hypothetical protein
MDEIPDTAAFIAEVTPSRAQQILGTARATLARSRASNEQFRERSADAPKAPARSRGRPLAPRDRTPPLETPPSQPTWEQEREAVFEAITSLRQLSETLADQLAAIRWRQLGSVFDTPVAAFGALKQWATTEDGGSNDKPKRNA